MTTPPAPLVHSAAEAGVATITLDSPHNRNALSTALIEQLLAALRAASADQTVRVIVLSHAGPVFSAGADLKETAEIFASMVSTGADAANAARALPASRMGEVLAEIAECPKPVVARLAGPARAGGLGIVAAADIAVCTTEATFAFAEVRVGVIPAIISATVLPRLSSRAAAELFLTGEIFDGARAEQVGLVNAAVPADELDQTVARFVDALLRGGPRALAGTKALLRRTLATTLRDDLAELTELSVGYFLSAEGAEGAAAFRERRLASWVPRR